MPLALIRRLVKMEEIFEVSVVDEEGNFYTPEPQSTHNSQLPALQLDESGKRASSGSKAELAVNAPNEPLSPEIPPPEPSQATSSSSGELEEDKMHLTDLQKAILSKVSLVQRPTAQTSANSVTVNDTQASCSSTTNTTPSKSKSVLLSFDERIASSDQSDEEIDDPEPLRGAWLHPKQRALFEATQSDSSPAFVDINGDATNGPSSIEVPSFNEIEILQATQRSPIIQNDLPEDVFDSPCNEDGSGQSDSNPSSETTKRISTLSGVKSLPVRPVSSATEAMNEVTSTKNLQSSFPKWQILEEGSTVKLPRKRFFEPPPNEEPQKPIGGTLDPRCKRQRRATLLTDEGPIDVSIVPSKAVRCPGETDKYRCPVTDCRLKGRQGSRVFISRHFCEEHKDFRSWRDVFIKKDAPPFILKDADPPRSTSSPTKSSLISPSVSIPRSSPSPKPVLVTPPSKGRQEEDEHLPALEKHVKCSTGSEEEDLPPIMTAQSSSITSGTETSWVQSAPICASSEVQSGPICASTEAPTLVYQTSPQVLPQVSQGPQNSVPIRSEPMVTVQVPASSFFSAQNPAQPLLPQSFPLVNPYQQMPTVPQAQNVPMALVPLSMLSGLQTQTQQCVPQILYPQQSDQTQGVQFLSPPGPPVNMATIPSNQCSNPKTDSSEIMVQGQKYRIVQMAVPSKIVPPSAVKGGPINDSHKPVHMLPISQSSPLWHQVVSSLNSSPSSMMSGQSQSANTKVVSSVMDSGQSVKTIPNTLTSQNNNTNNVFGPGSSHTLGYATQYPPQLQQILQPSQLQQQQQQPMTFQYVQQTQQVPQVQSGLPHQIPMSLVSMSQMMPQNQYQQQLQSLQSQTFPHPQQQQQPQQQAFMIPFYAQPQQQPQQ